MNVDFYWLPAFLVYLTICQVTGDTSISRAKRSVSDSERYSVVAEAQCGGTNIEVYYLDWSSSLLPSDDPEYTLIHTEFVSAPPEIYSDKAELEIYLSEVVEKVQLALAEDMEMDTWDHVLFQYLVSEDLFTLGDDYMWQWYIWLKEFFSDSGKNPFFYQWDWVRVVDGEEIGVNWWIILNYLRSDGFFNNYESDAESYGIIGNSRGSSIITFVPRGAVFSGRFPIQINGGRYSLYTGSNHGYGIEYLHYLVLYWLAKEDPNANSIVSPCVLKGDEYSIEIANRVLTVTGSGNYDECSAKLDFYIGLLGNGYDGFVNSGSGAPGTNLPGMVMAAQPDDEIPTSGGVGGSIKGGFGTSFEGSSSFFGGKRLPAINNDKYFLMGDYDVAFRTLGLIDGDGKADLLSLETKTKEYGNKKYTDVLSEFPEIDVNLASKVFQIGTYAPKLLQGYGFDLSTANVYTPRDNTGAVLPLFKRSEFEAAGGLGGGNAESGTSLGWAAGAMLANIPTRKDCLCSNK